MELECNDIVKIVLPAIRVTVADEMNRRYRMNQQEIADRLGIAQVAVSKYLNGKYSAQVKKIVGYIKRRRLAEDIARRAVASQNSDAVNDMINGLCTKIAYDIKVI